MTTKREESRAQRGSERPATLFPLLSSLSAPLCPLLAVATEPSSVERWTGIGTIIGLILLGILNKLDARRAVRAARESSRIAGETHILVNGNMGLQLRKAMLQSRRLADLTNKPEDVRIADEDEEIYKRHVAKQAVVEAANALIAQSRN